MASGLEQLFSAAAKLGASDIHLAVGSPVVFRIDGVLQRVERDAPLDDVVALPLQVQQGRVVAERETVLRDVLRADLPGEAGVLLVEAESSSALRPP